MRAPTLTFKRARSLRRDMSLPEGLLWKALRISFRGIRFRRQHAVGAYILDFYCPEWRLALEVDGATHHSPEAMTHDQRRTAWLETHGIRVLRFPAAAVLDDDRRFGVVQLIRETLRQVPPPLAGEGDRP